MKIFFLFSFPLSCLPFEYEEDFVLQLTNVSGGGSLGLGHYVLGVNIAKVARRQGCLWRRASTKTAGFVKNGALTRSVGNTFHELFSSDPSPVEANFEWTAFLPFFSFWSVSMSSTTGNIDVQQAVGGQQCDPQSLSMWLVIFPIWKQKCDSWPQLYKICC